MKKIICIAISIILIASFCSLSFAEIGIEDLNGAWYLHREDGFNLLLVINKNDTELFIKTLSYYYPNKVANTHDFISPLQKDAMLSNTFYCVEEDGTIYKMIVSDDGKTMKFGYVGYVEEKLYTLEKQ